MILNLSTLTLSPPPSPSTINSTKLVTFWNLTKRKERLAVPVESQSSSNNVISCVTGTSSASSNPRMWVRLVYILMDFGRIGTSSFSEVGGRDVSYRIPIRSWTSKLQEYGRLACRVWTFNTDWNGTNSINCSSVSLSTQSLAAPSVTLPFCNPVGLLPSNSALTPPKSLSAFNNSKPFTSTWSVTSLYPFGRSPIRQLLPLLDPPNPPVTPSASEASLLTIAWSFSGSAPTFSRTWPCLKTMKVGKLFVLSVDP